MTTKEIEIQLALGTLSYNMKIVVADNPNTSKEILTILSKDEDWYVKYYVAKNPNTPIEVFDYLIRR